MPHLREVLSHDEFVRWGMFYARKAQAQELATATPMAKRG